MEVKLPGLFHLEVAAGFERLLQPMVVHLDLSWLREEEREGLVCWVMRGFAGKSSREDLMLVVPVEGVTILRFVEVVAGFLYLHLNLNYCGEELKGFGCFQVFVAGVMSQHWVLSLNLNLNLGFDSLH